MVAGTEPNSENKLFVGGCPPGSSEEELREVFEKYGQVEEVFIMRGGSRSGMACAFIRFETQAMAQAAIDSIHGQITLPKTSEPLVVRWADAPGSRRKESRDRRPRSSNGSNGGREGKYQQPHAEGFVNYMNLQMYPQLTSDMQLQMHPQVFGSNYYMQQPQLPLSHIPAWQHQHMGQMAMMNYPPLPPVHPQATMIVSGSHHPMMMHGDPRVAMGFARQGLQQGLT